MSTSMPIMDPRHNLREVCKQIILLEDHLFHPERHCEDCITKHLLTAEAFAEEARSLDTDQELTELLNKLPGMIRVLFTMFQKGAKPLDMAQEARKLRKALMPETLKVRVAAKYLQGAGTAEDITDNLPAFVAAYQEFLKAVVDGQAQGRPGTHWSVVRAANGPWVQLMDRGFRIAEGILSTRSVPRRAAKNLEMAYRLCSNSRRMPKDVYSWAAKNTKRMDLLIEAARNWPEKEEGGAELFTVGSFRVHNTVGAKGPELESLKQSIEAVERAARSNPVRGFSQMVYGDIYVVGQLSKAHSAAWYRPADDSLYLRRTRRTGIDEVRAMVHELGHRWWAKRASRGDQLEWAKHHARMSVKSPPNPPNPKVGDEIPVKVKGMRGHPVVESIEGGMLRYRVPGGRLSGISERKVRSFMYSQAIREQNFPTPYSSTSDQEHFCEALSLKALRKLPSEHLEPFDRIWNGGQAQEEELLVATRKARKEPISTDMVAKFRKEMLTFLKNVNRGTFNRDYNTLLKFRRAQNVWAEQFEDYGKQIREDLQGRIRVMKNPQDGLVQDGALKWAEWYLNNMDPFWQFLFEFRHGMSWSDVDKAHEYKGKYGYHLDRELPKLTEEGRKWVNRVKRKALLAWKYLNELTEWASRTGFYGGGGDPVNLVTVESENVQLEGFKLRFEGFEDSWSKDQLPALKAGLRMYRQKAKRVFPWIIQHQLPIHVKWARGDSTAAATYNVNHIELHPWGVLSNPQELVKVMAHEMGHHVWQTLASRKMQDFWETAIRGDYTDLDLRDVLASGIKLFDRSSQQSHPILSLQWETLLHTHHYKHHDLISRDSIQEYLDAGGEPVVRVPAHPITGYAAKNNQEAFCEAVGMMVAYGPRTVLPEVRGWLRTILPELRVASTGSVAERWAQTFNVDVGMPVWFGKYKNQKGIVKSFRTNEKGDVLVTLEPDPKGRKQDKEIKLFKIRPRQVEKQAGIFEAPPGLLKAYMDWALPLYAGHVLHLTEQRLELLKDAQKLLKDAEADLEKIQRTYGREIEQLQEGEVAQWTLYDYTGDRLKTTKIGVRFEFRGLKGEARFRLDSSEKRLTFKRRRSTYVYGQAASWIEELIQRNLRTIRAFLSIYATSGQEDNPSLVEAVLLAKEARKYTSEAKSYKSLVKMRLPINTASLRDWRYWDKAEAGLENLHNKHVEEARKLIEYAYDGVVEVPDPTREYFGISQSYAPVSMVEDAIRAMESPDASDVLKSRDWDSVEVQLNFSGHDSRGGVWMENKRRLEVDVPSRGQAKTVAQFKDGIERLSLVARHEFQHLGQDLFKVLQGAQEERGLPSRSLRDQNRSPSGYPMSEKTNRPIFRENLRDDHAVQDVEFYTRLADEIDRFVRQSRSIPKSSWREAMRIWVGDSQVGDLMVDGRATGLRAQEFFRILKRRQPGKWRKAVSEFVAGVGKEINIPAGRTAEHSIFDSLDLDSHMPITPAQRHHMTARVAERHLDAGVNEWLQWMVQPFSVIWKHHREFVSGPVDDAMDAIIKELAPVLVKAIVEQEVDADVDEFMDGAVQGKWDASKGLLKDQHRSQTSDWQEGYAWGFDHPEKVKPGHLPPQVKKQLVEEGIREQRRQITEQVVKRAFKAAWHAVSPMTTFKAIMTAVKKHGWKLGVGFAIFEIVEHFVLPSIIVSLTGDPKWLALASIPVGEVIYAVVFRILGRTPSEADKADEDGHLDWYEAKYGPVRLACLS